ncbi:MAG: magnesium transporter [Armatimonadetes bacterium]|nr:magnesium transporter [Armatimonadota bacterium]
MFYLSNLIGKYVKNLSGEKAGKIFDFTILIGEQYPILYSAVIILNKVKKRILINQLQSLNKNGISLNVDLNNLLIYQIQDNEILLKEDLLDKQIVDTYGYRVVKVNDLQLNKIDGQYHLVGVDVGTQGLLRRLGLENIVEKLAKIFHIKFPQNIIPWDYVEPLDVKNFNYIKLAIPHQKLIKLHPADLADILSNLHGRERTQLFSSLDTEIAASTLEELEEKVQISLFNSLNDKQASEILEEMAPDEAADLLLELPDERSNELLNLMEEKEAKEVKQLLSYDENSAGGMMTTEYISISQNLTAQETINLLRELEPKAELVYYLYVVDENNHLTGVLSLRDLIIAKPETKVKDFMYTKVYKTKLNYNIKEAAEIINKYDLLAVPVVNEENQIKGIVTIDDIMELVLPSTWRRRFTKE